MIIYNGKNSLKDFDLYIASKDVPVPTRKVITETVPYMSGAWDFSFHDDGVDEYEELTIKYEFDVIADTKQELNKQRIELTNWLHSRGDQKLYDTDISTEEFYEVYRAQATWSEEGLQGLLTVEFFCYPFRYSKLNLVQTDLTEKGGSDSLTIVNTGSRAVKCSVLVNGECVLECYTDDGKTSGSIALSEGDYRKLLTLYVGENHVNISGERLVVFGFFAEVI